MINTIQRNTFKKKFLQTSLPHISLLTIQVKNTVTYMKQFGLMHNLKIIISIDFQSHWYSRTDMYKPLDTNYVDTENILLELQEEKRMACVQCEMLQMLASSLHHSKKLHSNAGRIHNVTHLLKARTVKQHRQPLLGNGYANMPTARQQMCNMQQWSNWEVVFPTWSAQ
jgi:hypothetical protein